MNKQLMKCGHSPNAKTTDGKDCCVICNCFEYAKEQPNLENRKAKCIYCGNTTKSHIHLAFFEHKPDELYDKYYDGCFGWD